MTEMEIILGAATLVGLTATVASLIVAVRERAATKIAKAAEQRAKEMYGDKCRYRCMELMSATRNLSDSSKRACHIVRTIADKAQGSALVVANLRPLTGHLYSIRCTINTLVDICNELNREYKREFKDFAISDLDSEPPKRICPEESETSPTL